MKSVLCYERVAFNGLSVRQELLTKRDLERVGFFTNNTVINFEEDFEENYSKDIVYFNSLEGEEGERAWRESRERIYYISKKHTHTHTHTHQSDSHDFS